MIIKKYTLLSILTGFSIFLFLFIYLFNIGYENKNHTSYDSIYYANRVDETLESTLDDNSLIQTLTTNPIALNWITIVKIGTIIKNYFGHYWFYGVLIINSVLFICILFDVSYLDRVLNVSRNNYLTIFVFIGLNLSLIHNISFINKEIYSFFFFFRVLRYYLNNNKVSILLISIFLGLIKIQFFLIGLVCFINLIGFKIRDIFIIFSLLLSVMYNSSFNIFVPLETYYSRFTYDDIGRSMQIMTTLNDLIKIPFGYLLVLPLRTLLNLLSGFSVWRLLTVDSFHDFCITFQNLLMAISTILLFFRFHRIKYIDTRILNYVFLVFLILGLNTFLQARYFFQFSILFFIIYQSISIKNIQAKFGSVINVNN